MEEERLANDLAQHLSAPNGAEGFAPILIALLRELSKGQPVSAGALAERAGLAAGSEAEILLKQANGVEWDDEGNVVGYALTLRETPHQFEVEGRKLYAWCALDTLFLPALLEKPARVRSSCPVTGAAISLEVSPDKLGVAMPSTAVISIVVSAPNASIQTTFCCNVHFFASLEAGAQWARGLQNAWIMPVERGFQLGRAVARAIRVIADSSRSSPAT
ncbi:organomercurial lyase MerB [Ramlibacter albus]|uniref:Organomercurial lyase MerB n=1 Tax=Ramlibacter albus TaxID=2079448 RepID=A0A923S4H5_9BURK|nr:organomercurial lyase MerB [Ramlibacter albus]MBC5767481.1 organomercurial lyase MerB [Ramlibacter albus]